MVLIKLANICGGYVPLNTSKNLDFPYWRYERFDLNDISDAECKSKFRFYRNDIYRLAEVLHIPEELTCYNRSKFTGIEAVCAFLKGFEVL